MKLEMMFIGGLLFGLVFALGAGILGEGLSRYNIDSDTSTTFGKMSYSLKSVYDYQDNVKDKLQGGEVTDQDAVDQMIKGGYIGVRSSPFNALTVATNASMHLAQETGFVDAKIIGFLIFVMITLVTFAIVAIIFKFETR